MAVINSPQIGIARGKLGDAVYYRSKGNTNARSYNPNTTNRRTTTQQTQRAFFSSAVKFFSRGTQNLFVFAYEDKRTQESDYNAFMRYNTKRGMFFGPLQNEDPNYPALGDWVMTQGSLPRLDYEYESGSFRVRVIPSAAVPTVETVAQLSQLLLTSPEWSVGDIFTLVSIGSDAGPGTATEPVTGYTAEPFWLVRQFFIDESDGTLLSEFGLEYVTEEGAAYLEYSAEYPIRILRIEGFCAIHSRSQNGKLRVSDSTLIYNTQGVNALSYGRGQSWLDIVLADWGSEQLSILQGGIAERQVRSVEYQVLSPVELPASIPSLVGKSIILSPEASIDNILLHLRADIGSGGVIVPVYTNSLIRFISQDNHIVLALAPSAGPGITVLTVSTTDYDETLNAIYWA